MIGNSWDKANLPHKILLTVKQVLSRHKAFANNLSASTKSSQTQLSKVIQSRGYLGRFLGPLIKNWFTINGKCIKIIS